MKRKQLHNERTECTSVTSPNMNINSTSIEESNAIDLQSSRKVFDPSKQEDIAKLQLMVLPMEGRSKHKFPFNNDATLLYYREITKNHSDEYYMFQQTYQKFDFISNIIAKLKVTNYVIIKFDKSIDKYIYVPDRDLYDIISKRLRNLHANIKQTQNVTSSPDVSSHQINQKSSSIKKKKSGKKVRKAKLLSHFDDLQNNPSLNEMIESYNIDGGVLSEEFVKRCKYFSIIHSLKSGFNFYVYSYSHRVKDEARIVHQCTKTKLIFPSWPTMYVIFHSRLVHSGAESRFESNNSTSQSHDARTFSYVELVQDNQKDDSRRHSTRDGNREYFKQDGSVNRKLTSCDTSNIPCSFCKKFGQNYNSRMFKEVNLLDEYNTKITNLSSGKMSLPPNSVICGDLYTFGWEVRLGEDIRNKQKYSLFNSEICRMIYKCPQKKWNGIDDGLRRYFALMKDDQVESGDNVINESSFPQTFQLFKSIEKLVNTNVSFNNGGNGNKYVLNAYSILLNFGFLMEQGPHRDYPTRV